MDKPRVGNHVWLYNNDDPLLGVVESINWSSKEVRVKFFCFYTIGFDPQRYTTEVQRLPLSDFEDNYAGEDQWQLTRFDYECYHGEEVSALQVKKDDFEAIKELVDTGDENLTTYRSRYKIATGEEMELTDEQLIAALAATDDDDDERFLKNVNIIKSEGYTLVDEAA